MENCPKLTTSPSNDDIFITKNNFLIGRGLQCDYVITNLGISRLHCIISLINNNWQLIDKSTNGTKHNDAQLKNGDCAPLKNGDLIKIGNEICLTFHFLAENDGAEPKTKSRRLESTEDDVVQVGNVQEVAKENIEGGSEVSEVGLGVSEVGLGVPEVGLKVSEVGLVVPEVGLGVSEVGLKVSEVGLKVSEVGLGVSEVELKKSEVGLGVSEVGLKVSEVRLKVSEVGLGVSEVGLKKSEVGLGVSEVGLGVPEVGLKKSEVGLKVSEVGLGVSETSAEKSEPVTEKTVDHLSKHDSVLEEFYCAICSELFIKAITLNCSHTFCQFCIGAWKKTKMDCPICRAKITTLTPTLILDNLVEKIVNGKDEEFRNDRLAIVKERELLSNTKTADNTNQPSSATIATSSSILHVNGNNIQINLIGDSDDDDNDSFIDYNDTLSDDNDYDGYYDEGDSNDDDDDDDDDDGNDFLTPYNGIPGAYFGGYGRCYVCGDRGHWANGCPHK